MSSLIRLELNEKEVPFPAPQTWDSALAAAQRASPGLPQAPAFYYVDDDEDRIVVDSAETFAEAVRLGATLHVQSAVVAPSSDTESLDGWQEVTSEEALPAAAPLSVGPAVPLPAPSPQAIWVDDEEDEHAAVVPELKDCSALGHQEQLDEDSSSSEPEPVEPEDDLSEGDAEPVHASNEDPEPVPVSHEDPQLLSKEEEEHFEEEDAEPVVFSLEHDQASAEQQWRAFEAQMERETNAYCREFEAKLSLDANWQLDEAVSWAAPLVFDATLPSAELQGLVADLVHKILCAAPQPPVDVAHAVCKLLANPAALEQLAAHLGDARVRQALAAVASAELAHKGDGSKLAKVQILTRFSAAAAHLIHLVPELEPVLLALFAKRQHEPAAPAPVEHVQVQCDGCNASAQAARVAEAQGFRNPASGFIQGVRYKSVTTTDYDLCQACEASGAHQDAHGPFLKLTKPSECPKVIICAADANALPQVHDSALARDFADFCKRRNTRRQCTHELQAFTTSRDSFTCDGCKSRVPVNTTLFGCRACNFDLCQACHVVPATAAATAPASPALPQAKFVCDITIADGSVVRPGQHLDKTWRIRNTGDQPWPSGTKICHVGGESLGGPVFGKPVPMVAPGEACNVTIDLIMPTTPGRYTSYWRLVSPLPTSAKFGHRFWVTVHVVPAIEPPRVAPAPSIVSAADDEFAQSVAQIIDFGFHDVDTVQRVLREEDGDTGRAIDRLLQESH